MNHIEASMLSNKEWTKLRDNFHIKNVGMKKDLASKILFEVDDILKDLNIEYFLSCGTALGFKREGDFIDWDDEIDLDIKSEYFVPNFNLINNKFLSHEFIVRPLFRGKTSKTRIFKKGIKVAIGSIYDNNKGFRCDFSQKFPSKFYHNPEKISYNDRFFPVPSPIEDYLEFYYGDWKVPIKSYNISDYLNKDKKWKL